MVQIKKMIPQVLQQLYFFKRAEIDTGSIEPLSIHLSDNRSQISLFTVVYVGQEYIPNGVRTCLDKEAPFQNPLRTYLTIDEEQYKIYLNYTDGIDHLSHETLNELLEEFNMAADEWRLYLDENDKKDLIHVRAR